MSKVPVVDRRETSKTPLHELPGPPGRIRSTFRLMSKPYPTYAEWQRRYGSTYRVKALNGNVVVTSNTENIRRVLAARHDEISQFAIGTLTSLIGEDSVLLVNGPRHKRARGMLMPAFHGEALQASFDTMESVARRVTENWHPGASIRVMDASLEYSLEVIIQVVFGVQDIERVQTFKQAIRTYVSSFRPIFAFTRFFQKRRVPQWNRFLAQKAAFSQLLDEQIADRRHNPGDRGDVLATLLATTDEDGNPLSDDELKDQLITLLFAGHETTQIAIGWAMSWLHRSPQVLRRLRAEIDTAASLRACLESPLLHGVCLESLRLNPIVADFLRVMKKPLELEEVDLPANSTVGILTCRVHDDPLLYPGPGKFDPDRWQGQTARPVEFLAFGGGVRRCIGATMAILEMKIALVCWLQMFEFELPRNAPAVEPVGRRNLTMAPRSGIPLIVTQRRS